MRGLHAGLLAAGWGGRWVLRADVERAIMARYGVGEASARKHVSTGSALGLWETNGAEAMIARGKLPTRQEPALLVLPGASEGVAPLGARTRNAEVA